MWSQNLIEEKAVVAVNWLQEGVANPLKQITDPGKSLNYLTRVDAL